MNNNIQCIYIYITMIDYYHADGVQCSILQGNPCDCFFFGECGKLRTCPVEAQRSRGKNGGVCFLLWFYNVEICRSRRSSCSQSSQNPHPASKALIAALADASVVVALSRSKMLATMVDQTCGALDTTESGDE